MHTATNKDISLTERMYGDGRGRRDLVRVTFDDEDEMRVTRVVNESASDARYILIVPGIVDAGQAAGGNRQLEELFVSRCNKVRTACVH